MTNKINNKDVAILLTTYNPNIAVLSRNISTYINQCGQIYLVDNSPVPFDYSLLPSAIKIHTLNENKGIAAAQNIGYHHANNDGYKFFLEIDQDSKLSDKYVDTIYRDFIEIVDANGPILGVGPIAISEEQGIDYYNYGSLKGAIPVRHTLSSGFFYSNHGVEVCGLKNEGLFIDLVDWEWCMRAKSFSLLSFVTPNVKILHSLGEGHKVIGPFKIGVPKPFRHYYQFRNTILLVMMKHIPFGWKVKNIFKIAFKICIYPIILDEGFSRAKFMIKGLVDGFGKKYTL